MRDIFRKKGGRGTLGILGKKGAEGHALGILRDIFRKKGGRGTLGISRDILGKKGAEWHALSTLRDVFSIKWPILNKLKSFDKNSIK